jgi:hypothetical protein
MASGLGVLGIWTSSLAGGAFGGAPGLFVFQDGNYPIFHLVAETFMAVTAVVAGVALWRRARAGRRLAMLALGMLAYSAINSSGWPLRHDPTLLIPMGITFLGAALAAPYLLRGPAPPARAGRSREPDAGRMGADRIMLAEGLAGPTRFFAG